ncbi:MAG: hypothetical protein GY822_04540 [Deltaproteobacteria bacterium]|nr:hypothetical protein [Deltaproteobacteria bacterium]
MNDKNDLPKTFPSPGAKIDLARLRDVAAVNLQRAFSRLKMLYDEVDERNERNTAALNLPCHAGCSSCCEDAVFVTPLEFYALWNHCQKTLSDDVRIQMVRRAQQIYRVNRKVISQLGATLEPGENHVQTARQLRFSCPILDDHGVCQAYAYRELAGRLFGASFNEEHGIYGCDDVGDHLAGKEITLIQAESTSRRLSSLPLTQHSQVFPAYFVQLYGEGDPTTDIESSSTQKRRNSALPIVDEQR